MNTPFGSPCTRYLKKEVRKKWESEYPDHHTYVWGFDVNERSRAENTCKALSDYGHEFPLIEHGLTKQEAHGMAYCYADGVQNAVLRSHFGTDDHHIYDQIQKVLVRVITIVMKYEDEEDAKC